MKGSSFRNATVFDTCSVIDLESEFKFLLSPRLTSSRELKFSNWLEGCVDIKENQTATNVSKLN